MNASQAIAISSGESHTNRNGSTSLNAMDVVPPKGRPTGHCEPGLRADQHDPPDRDGGMVIARSLPGRAHRQTSAAGLRKSRPKRVAGRRADPRWEKLRKQGP